MLQQLANPDFCGLEDLNATERRWAPARPDDCAHYSLNVEEAARSVGVPTATLMRWQKLPEFQAAYREARRTVFGQAVARLQGNRCGGHHSAGTRVSEVGYVGLRLPRLLDPYETSNIWAAPLRG